jgi:hypothetical protein
MTDRLMPHQPESMSRPVRSLDHATTVPRRWVSARQSKVCLLREKKREKAGIYVALLPESVCDECVCWPANGLFIAGISLRYARLGLSARSLLATPIDSATYPELNFSKHEASECPSNQFRSTAVNNVKYLTACTVCR